MLGLGLESSNFQKCKTFLQMFFFSFYKPGKLLPEINKFFSVPVSWNKRKFHFLKYKGFFRVSVSWNIRKAFFWKNIRNFLIIELESLISWNIKKYNSFSEIFLYVLSLGLKAHQVTQYYNTIFDNTSDSISIRPVEIYFQ